MNNLGSVNNLGKSFYIGEKEENINKNEQQLPQFKQMEYTNKNDGKTYVAIKSQIQEKGKYVAIVFVYAKDAQPDEKGNIKGEYMSFEKFMQKLGDELPRMTSSQVKAYNPNINTMSPEERFDKGMENGVKLSDGSVLVRPHIVNTGSTEIKSLGKGLYEVKSTSFVGGHKHMPQIRVMTEKQLLGNKFLCAGTIKALDDGTYDVRAFDHDKTTGKVSVENCDKDYCITMMKTNFVHF